MLGGACDPTCKERMRRRQGAAASASCSGLCMQGRNTVLTFHRGGQSTASERAATSKVAYLLPCLPVGRWQSFAITSQESWLRTACLVFYVWRFGGWPLLH